MARGFREWLDTKRAIARRRRASTHGAELATIAGQQVAAAIAATCGVSNGQLRLIKGLETGITAGATAAALGGSVAGPYGAAIAGVATFSGGLAYGAWPMQRDALDSQFAAMVKSLTPGLRFRLLAWTRTWAAVARLGDGNQPIADTWRTIDERNINEFGSNQFVVERMIQCLVASDWRPHLPPISSAAPFDELPWSARYGIGVAVSRNEDTETFRPAGGGLFNEHGFGDTSVAMNMLAAFQFGTPSAAFPGQPDLARWFTDANAQGQRISFGEIRSKLRTTRGMYGVLPGIDTLPSDPQSLSVLADPREIGAQL